MQPGAFLGQHLGRGAAGHPVRAVVDLLAEHRARRLELGETGVLGQQVRLARHQIRLGDLDRVLAATLAGRVGRHTGGQGQPVVAAEGQHLRVAHRDPGDVLDRHRLLVVGLLCPAVLCARPPENPAGVAVSMARVRAHNEIDGKTIASCPCCRKGSCRHAGEVLREARNG